MSKPRKTTQQTRKQRHLAFVSARSNMSVARLQSRKPYTEPWEARSFVGSGEPATRLGVYSADGWAGRSQRFSW